MGQVGNLGATQGYPGLPPPVRGEFGKWPINNRRQLTKLPHKVSVCLGFFIRPPDDTRHKK